MSEAGKQHWELRGKRWVMCASRGGKALISVVPDKVYAGMWRVLQPSGELSDMVNLSRAKDAAWQLWQSDTRRDGGPLPAATAAH